MGFHGGKKGRHRIPNLRIRRGCVGTAVWRLRFHFVSRIGKFQLALMKEEIGFQMKNTSRPARVVLAAIALIGLMVPSPVQAQGYYGGSLSPRQHGYEHGYRD